MEHSLFDLDKRSYTRAKGICVRVKPEIRQRLDLIASTEHWVLSDMLNKMIQNFIDEYERRPKPKQPKFDFAGWVKYLEAYAVCVAT